MKSVVQTDKSKRLNNEVHEELSNVYYLQLENIFNKDQQRRLENEIDSETIAKRAFL